MDNLADKVASELITHTENALESHGELELYDVYIEYNTLDYEIWLRDRADDSRIGPFDRDFFKLKLQ